MGGKTSKTNDRQDTPVITRSLRGRIRGRIRDLWHPRKPTQYYEYEDEDDIKLANENKKLWEKIQSMRGMIKKSRKSKNKKVLRKNKKSVSQVQHKIKSRSLRKIKK